MFGCDTALYESLQQRQDRCVHESAAMRVGPRCKDNRNSFYVSFFYSQTGINVEKKEMSGEREKCTLIMEEFGWM